MPKRDYDIISDLKRFRVMTRDDIIDIHFKGVKHPVTQANATLLRLYRQGQIERSTDHQPFLYFPADNHIKKNSAKIPHFLEIVGVYRQMLRYAKPWTFTVEPKYGKGLAEPDVFAIFKASPLFIEVQRSNYTDKQINDKIARYEALFDSKIVHKESWQPTGRQPIFPAVLILTESRYAVSSNRFPIIQARTIDEFMRIVSAVPANKKAT
jgi:hypothetical protein